jgi:hypothetical protein
MTQPPEVLPPGIYDIPEEQYFAASYALSCSGAKLLLPPSCPAKFFWRQDHAEYKDDWDFGSAAHLMVLGAGPEIAEIPFGDWRKKDAQQQRDEARAAGKTPLLSKDLAKVRAMAAAIRAHPIAGFLFDPCDGRPEQSLFWEHERTGTPLRARLDWLPGMSTGRPIIADYKTADSADPEKFRKAAADYGYHQQHAWYADGLAALYGVAPSFIFVVQEKTPPYLVSVVEWEPEAVRIGRARNERAIGIYLACIKNGEWPGYTDTEPAPIMLPAWADKGEDW